MNRKEQILEQIKSGVYRPVQNPQRRRKLRKRGEDVWWCPEFNTWLWEPKLS